MAVNLTIRSDISELPGVGAVKQKQLNRMGIFTVADLLYHLPRAYENRADICTLGALDTTVHHAYALTVATNVTTSKVKNRLTISKFRAFDETGSCEVVFFNSPFVKDVFSVGQEYRFYGRTSFSKNRRLVLTAPKYELITDKPLDAFVPIYHLTEGINSKYIDKLISTAISEVLPLMPDPIPPEVLTQYSLPTLQFALRNIHHPENDSSLAIARRRLAFDELFKFGLKISLAAGKRASTEGVQFQKCSLVPFLEQLPYELTGSQKAVINDVYYDTVIAKTNGMKSAMSRIISGDVGSGKTVCAAAALYICARSGYQSALMAPTEILATQHYNEISSLFAPLGIKTELITGSLTATKKQKIYSALENGEIDVLIGTHALISDGVSFARLGLIITDEQHRFGVRQRAVLKNRSTAAHMLVMSATPIPRTLALTMYGDLDTSRITEMPKGRTKVDTFVVNEEYRIRLNDFIRKQVMNGGQCYVICPAIERSEESNEYISTSLTDGLTEERGLNLKYVTEHTEQLKKALPDIEISALHGKMKASEKAAIMDDFASGKTKVLVSTTVIEVGVNVPNASLMIIENAERFGLSQLHQLRGRVGRGSRKSYCVLVSDSTSEKAQARLGVIKSTHDGFEIAEKDLVLRGPGDFFSSYSNENMRQSGGFEFKIAGICDDNSLIDSAFSAAKQIIANDPKLEKNTNLLLREEVEHVFSQTSTIS